MKFSNSLLHWYLQHKRDLPWRNTKNPYFIWLSEIMLQQTRVAQGLPYYTAFTNVFPTVFDLANAPEDHILKLWQGLGYYSRARNLHLTAKYIATAMNGCFPCNYNDLLLLKGIGTYTAAAIASFAYDEVVPVLDGNVFRVLARYFDIDTDISSAPAKKEFTNLAKKLIPKNNAATFNQAIMEFGALQCVPKNPNCSICIFNTSCLALGNKKVAQLPVKLKKTKVTNRYFNYLVFLDDNNNTVTQQRTEKDIWQNLYEFPLIETTSAEEINLVEPKIRLKYNSYVIKSIVLYNNQPIIHKLSHQKLYVNFYEVMVFDELKNGISIKEIEKLPFSIVIFNFIKKFLK